MEKTLITYTFNILTFYFIDFMENYPFEKCWCVHLFQGEGRCKSVCFVHSVSDFFDKWPETLTIFKTILYRNVWEIIIIVIVKVVKLGKCPELSAGHQEHCFK